MLLEQISMTTIPYLTKVITCADLDLKYYEGRWSQEEANSHQKYGTFVKFSFLDISTKKLYDDDLNNAAVRSEQNKDDATDDIAYSYEEHGWDYNPFPPIISTTGKLKDGRTRIRAAISAGWKRIPVAIFTYDPSVPEEVSDVVDGLIANNHLVSRRASMGDITSSGVYLVGKGYINRDQASIDDWLYNQVQIERFYSNVSGTITKISKAILAQSTPNGDPIIVDKDRSEWIGYLEDCKEVKALGIALPDSPTPLNENQLVLYSTGKTNARRCWVDQILSNTTHGHHTYIVLYSTEKTAEKLRQEMKAFADDLEMFYTQTVKLINSQLPGIQISLPEERPFTIVGAIPQFADDETHKELRSLKRLISLDQF
jgi:hypothetical protein